MRKTYGIGSTFRFIALALSFILFSGTVPVDAAEPENKGTLEVYNIHDITGIAGIDMSSLSLEACDTASEDAINDAPLEGINDGPVISEEAEEIPNEGTVAYFEDSGPEYTNVPDPLYLMLGEQWFFLSFESPMFNSYFPGKRTVKPQLSKKGILKCTTKKDSDGDKIFSFSAVKPGETEITFVSTFTGGRYVSKPYKVCVLAPVLTRTKFDIASLNTTLNLNDYIVGMEDFDRDYAIIWSSSKSSVADVDSDGNITVKGSGTSKIKGIFDTGAIRKASVTATINVKIPKMNKSSVTLIPGQKVKISLSNMPKGKTVDNWNLNSWGYKVRDDVYRDGLEMATPKGNSCEITAYMECGGTLTAIVDGDSYVCDITVKAPVIKKREMKLKPGKSSKISVSGTKFKPNVFIYETSDSAVATVDENGKVTAVGSGTAYIDVYLYQTRACARDDIENGGARVTVIVP